MIIGSITVLDLIAIVVIMAAAVMAGKIVTIYLKKTLSDKMKKDELVLFVRVVNYLIIILGLVIASPHFRTDLSGLLVAGGVLGVIIGFASQSVVSNLVSGLFLIIERPVKIGDNIKIGDVSGIIDNIQIFSTIIRAHDGIFIRVPNEKIFTSNITNYVAHAARRFEYRIGISYRDDAGKAIVLIRGLVEAHPFVLRTPSPDIFVDALGESSVILVVRMWAPSREWYGVKTDLLWRIKVLLEENGIEIPYPQQVVWVSPSPARPGDIADDPLHGTKGDCP